VTRVDSFGLAASLAAVYIALHALQHRKKLEKKICNQLKHHHDLVTTADGLR
jgi:hypothetical protein